MSSTQEAQARRRSRIKTWAYVLSALFTVLLCGLLLLIQTRLEENAESINAQARELRDRNVFPNGIFVDSVPIGLMSEEEAREMLMENLSNRCKLSTVTLRFGQEAYILRPTPEMMTTNLDEVLAMAKSVGQELSDTEYQNFLSRLPYYPIEFSVDMQIDPSPLEEEVRARAEALSVPAEDACLLSFDPTKPEYQRFTYQKEVYGASVDADWLWNAVQEEFAHRQDGVVEVRTTRIRPAILVADLQMSNAKVASFSTSLPEDEAQREDFTLLCSQLSGTILNTGEAFSWNSHIGTLKEENGYHPDAHLDLTANQTATTVMNAAMLAGFTISTHAPDPALPAYVPQGCEALVDAEHDLVIVNTSASYAILILEPDEDNALLTVEIYGVPALAGYHVEIKTAVAEVIPVPQEVNYIATTRVERGQVVRSAGQEGSVVVTSRVYSNPETAQEIGREEVFRSEYPPLPRRVFYHPDDGVPNG